LVNKVMKVVIIAGGQGTRIASVASEIPKAMIPINGKPILEYQVEMAKSQGFVEFIFIIGYLGNHIKEYFGNGEKHGVSISYYEETKPLGTAGALAYLKEQLTEDFFVFYGDTVMDIDMKSMAEFHVKHKADATLLLHPNDHPYDSDIVDIDSSNKVIRFLNKPHADDLIARNIVNAALFIFSPKVLSVIPQGEKCHIEKNILPKYLSLGMNLIGYVSAEYIKDMGTPDRYYSVCNDVMSGKVARLNKRFSRPAIFLDRDGVVTKEINLLHKSEDLELIQGVPEAIRLINKSDYLVIIVTNQPVIARNLCSIEDLEHIHAKLETILGSERAYLNSIYYCPHHPDKGYPEERPEYKIICDCRKPKPGMLLKAANDWNIDLSKSYMIGDRDSDIKAGESAGCLKSIKIETNKPDALLDVVKLILTNK
jgi:D,D-heptose 1,7-bisphosphate phosphatase